MTKPTEAEKKARQRARKRAAGFVEVRAWVKAQDAARARAFLSSLCRPLKKGGQQ